MKCDVVFEGGGVKGIAYVGTINALLSQGYTIQNTAGSSAGAIVAAMVAAGYQGQELYTIMKQTDYSKFCQKSLLDHLGKPGEFASILLNYGVYRADYAERWVQDLLAQKNISCFKDVKNTDGTYRLHVTAVDLSTKKIYVFPDDLWMFGIDPDYFPIAVAVRMSMSIPIYFEPYVLKDIQDRKHYMVDGGLISNYPIWILDDGMQSLSYPVFGVRFQNTNCRNMQTCWTDIKHIDDYLKSIVQTWMDAEENYRRQIITGDTRRTIFLSSKIQMGKKEKEIGVTDFQITPLESEALYRNGYQATIDFLKDWDFAKWKEKYRKRL